MPWQLEQRDGKYCVVKKGETAPVPGGCHPDRASAIKHQRALYANESRMASIYDALDARFDEEPVEEPVAEPPLEPSMSPVTAKIMALLLEEEKERSLVASIADQQSLMVARMQQDQEERMALVAALGRMGSPTINLPPAEVNVTVPPAEVNFTVPPAEITVNVPETVVNVPAAQITVQPADVNVTLPERSKTVTFERDLITQQLIKAEVTET